MTSDESIRDFVLLKFAKGEDRPCGKVPLASLSLAEAQQIAGVDTSNPMYDSYPVASANLFRSLQVHASERLDGAKFDYFLERG